jgi:hypothetical protein
MNFVICIYIQMNVVLNMAVVWSRVVKSGLKFGEMGEISYYGSRRVRVENFDWCVYINMFMNLLPFGTTTKYGNLWWFNMMQSYIWMCLVLLILLI